MQPTVCKIYCRRTRASYTRAVTCHGSDELCASRHLYEEQASSELTNGFCASRKSVRKSIYISRHEFEAREFGQLAILISSNVVRGLHDRRDASLVFI